MPSKGSFIKTKQCWVWCLCHKCFVNLNAWSAPFRRELQQLLARWLLLRFSGPLSRPQRQRKHCSSFFEEVTAVVQSLGVLVVWSAQSRPPRNTSLKMLKAHQSKSAKYHKRVEFFKVLHTADAELTELFKQGDLLTFWKMEDGLLSGEIDATALNRESLLVQLFMIHLNY